MSDCASRGPARDREQISRLRYSEPPRRFSQMRRRVGLTLALPFFTLAAAISVGAQPAQPSPKPPAWLDAYRDPAARLIGEAVSGTFAWDRLAVLTDTIGNRLSGTPALDRAIQWAVAEMTNVAALVRANSAR